jgi:hypothetical protein
MSGPANCGARRHHGGTLEGAAGQCRRSPSSFLNGIGAPRGTPVQIVDLLNREINAGLADPTMQARFDDLGIVVLKGSPADFAGLIGAETAKWAQVVKFTGARAESVDSSEARGAGRGGADAGAARRRSLHGGNPD